MTDIALFRLRNPLISELYRKGLLLTFGLFMIAGNFFRCIPLPFLPSSFSIVEALLYALTIPYYFSKLRPSFFICIAIFASSLYGIFCVGLDLTSVLYSFKLLGMISAGVAIGEVLKKEGGIPFLIRIFTWILFFGALIFIFFPKAHTFFALLEGFGVKFFGDPHERRFISTFFDPNYYAAIALIPTLLAWRLRKKRVYFLLSILFFLSILLTFSRSGIAATAVVLLGSSLFKLKDASFRPLRFLPPLFFLSLPLFFVREFAYLSNRSLHFFEDPSALHRLSTFQYGFDIFLKHPLLGIGYNTLPLYLRQQGYLSHIDTSLLIGLITFGLIPILIFALYGMAWTFKKWATFTPLFKSLYFYLIFSILFTSLFNNLLFYQFWLIPMIALFTYAHENSTCP